MISTIRTAVIALSSRFAREANGSVTIIMGVIFPVLILAAGGATDISRAYATQTKAQRTLDAAVLSMARSGMTDAEIAEQGPEVFASWMIDRNVDGAITDATFTSRKTGTAPGRPGTVTGTARIETRTYFLGLFGRKTLGIALNSASEKPNPLPYEIALVLDVSGSMNDMLGESPRIDRMKESALAMLDEIERQSVGRAAPAISLVPYSTSVNIGDLGTDPLDGASAVSAEEAPPAGADVWAAERRRGLDGERYDLSDEGPSTAPIPFLTAGELPEATPTTRVQGPSTTPATYRGAIDDMEAEGWTAAHMGMIWGVYALSPAWSSVWTTAPRPYGQAKKVIVVLTDGAFNTTHTIGARTTEDGDESDRYFQSACDLAKEKGFTIYTIALALDTTSKDRLAACADGSDGRMFSADSAETLADAFKDIARDLGGLRLSG